MPSTTLAQITEEIASHLKKELDEPFKRLLADKVHAWRGTLVRRTLQEHPRERVHFRQTIWVKMESAPVVPTCVDGQFPGCDQMRSTKELPAALRAGDVQFDYVGSADGKNPFRQTIPGTTGVLLSGKYSKNVVFYDTVNNYLVLDNATGIPLVRIDGIFDNPEEVAGFNCKESGGGCDGFDDPYPVSNDIKQAIVQCILTVDYQVKITPDEKEIEVNPEENEQGRR